LDFIKLDIKSDIKAPFFIGSSVRGGLGAALKSVVCVNPTFECEGCFGQESCIYYDLYEKKNRFHLFRLDIELNPSTYNFGLYLFGSLMERYPYIVSALHKLFTHKGLGAQRATTQNFEISAQGEALYKDGRFYNVAVKPKNLQIDNYCPDIRVKFVTPLRIKKHGRLARPENLEIKDVLVSIAKKETFYEGDDVRFGELPRVKREDVRFLDLTRYSNRQKTKMKIGGVVGEMELEGVSEDIYRLLKVGEVVGVGKLGTFGLGKIEVEEMR